jgi:ABC-type transporter Mla maintaining outer membrane lipid asymmetry permease subunit MlaE
MADNPYQAPRSDVDLRATRVDLRRAAAAFCAWLVGSSALSGAVLALQTVYALRHFSAEAHTGGLVAVAAARAVAPHVAASAASVALVVGGHRLPPPSTVSRRTVAPWWIYAAVPAAMPIAACTMIGAGLGAMALIHGVHVETWWASVVAITVPGDLGFGMVCATTYAVLLGATAFVAAPRLAAVRWGLAAKIMTTLLATGLVTGLASAALIAILVPQDSAGGAR